MDGAETTDGPNVTQTQSRHGSSFGFISTGGYDGWTSRICSMPFAMCWGLFLKVPEHIKQTNKFFFLSDILTNR